MRATPEQRFDHDRAERNADWRPGDAPSFDQRASVASLIGHCEAIAASGRLTEPAERSLRFLIAQTLTAFGMPAKVEPARLA